MGGREKGSRLYVCMFLRSSDEYIRIFATRIGIEMCIFVYIFLFRPEIVLLVLRFFFFVNFFTIFFVDC